MIEYKLTDGGKLSAGFYKEKNDCTVRALSLACDIPYEDAHKLIKEKTGRKDGGACFGFASFMNKHVNYVSKLVSKPWKADGNIGTLNKFIKDNPKGSWVLAKNGHAFAVIDGVIHDSWKVGLKSQIRFAWKIK